MILLKLKQQRGDWICIFVFLIKRRVRPYSLTLLVIRNFVFTWVSLLSVCWAQQSGFISSTFQRQHVSCLVCCQEANSGAATHQLTLAQRQSSLNLTSCRQIDGPLIFCYKEKNPNETDQSCSSSWCQKYYQNKNYRISRWHLFWGKRL